MDSIYETQWLMFLLSALAGYLAGSLSFARIITLIVTSSKHIRKISAVVPGTDLTFESDSISATVVSQNLGKKYGCLTAILDMCKVAIPAFLLSYFFPEEYWYLSAALFGLFGHNYPLYHRFKGGRGESPMLGAMLVINWYGILIANGASSILGFLTGSILVMRYGWYILMIFWYWIHFHSLYHVAFMVLANILFWTAMSGDLQTYNQMRKENDLDVSEETVSEFLLMGKGPGRFLDRYGLPALIKRALKKT